MAPVLARRLGRSCRHDEVDHGGRSPVAAQHPALPVGAGPVGQDPGDQTRHLVPVAEVDQRRPEPVEEPADQLPGRHRRPGLGSTRSPPMP